MVEIEFFVDHVHDYGGIQNKDKGIGGNGFWNGGKKSVLLVGGGEGGEGRRGIVGMGLEGVKK